jgi:hypothetical protein
LDLFCKEDLNIFGGEDLFFAGTQDLNSCGIGYQLYAERTVPHGSSSCFCSSSKPDLKIEAIFL